MAGMRVRPKPGELDGEGGADGGAGRGGGDSGVPAHADGASSDAAARVFDARHDPAHGDSGISSPTARVMKSRWGRRFMWNIGRPAESAHKSKRRRWWNPSMDGFTRCGFLPAMVRRKSGEGRWDGRS